MLTFAPLKFLHPVRVTRLRTVSIVALLAWSALALVALARDLDPGWWVTGGLLGIALYFFAVGSTDLDRAQA